MARTMSPALRRYLIRLAVLMAIYIVCIFTAGYLFRLAFRIADAFSLAIEEIFERD